MLTIALRGAVLALWLFWFFAYWQGGWRIVSDIRRSLISGGDRLDTASLACIALLSPVLPFTGLAMVAGWLDAGQNDGAAFAGAWVTAIGMAGTFFCRHILGRFWTAETALQESHRVVDRGPYRIVRHPIYTFACLMYAGTAFVFSTWWTWIASSLVIAAYVVKTAREDAYLLSTLAGYAGYSQRVRYRLVPGLW